LWRSTEPPVRSRFKTAPAFVPQSAGTRAEVMRDFERLQAALRTELQAAQEVDLGRLRIVSPFAKRLRYNLFSAFSILPAHQRRHLWQAEQAAREREGPMTAARRANGIIQKAAVAEITTVGSSQPRLKT
jgi:hypothetical protein